MCRLCRDVLGRSGSGDCRSSSTSSSSNGKSKRSSNSNTVNALINRFDISFHSQSCRFSYFKNYPKSEIEVTRAPRKSIKFVAAVLWK